MAGFPSGLSTADEVPAVGIVTEIEEFTSPNALPQCDPDNKLNCRTSLCFGL